MTWKRPIFAFVIFVLMVMALVLDTQIIANRKVIAVRDASLADSVDISAVDQLLLKNSQGSVKLIRTTTGWRMKEPVDAPADPEIVETLLTNVTSARRRNKVEAKNMAQYGLGTPEVELTLVSEDGAFGDWGTSFGLQLGFESTYTGQVFGKYPGEDYVFTVGEHVKNTLLRSPLDFRRARILDIDTGNLNQYTAFSIKSPDDDGVTLANSADGWKIVEPVEAGAEQNIINEYFNRLGMLRAYSYVTEKSDRPTSAAAALEALTSPTLVVTLQGQQGTRPQQLNIAIAEGPDGPVYVAQHPGEKEIMALTSETVGDLRKNSHYFRSRELFTMKPADVGLFTIQIGRAAPTALVKNEEDGQWELVGDPEFRVNQRSVSERLGSLLGLRIEDYIDPNPVDLANYGLDNPRIRFTITSAGDKKKVETLEVGSPEGQVGGLSYARSSMDKGVFTVQISPEMLIIASQIADKHFAAVEPDRVVRVEMDLDGETFKLKRAGDEWTLLKPSQTAPTTVDLREVYSLLDMVNALQYEEDVSGNVVVAPNEGPPVSIRFFGAEDAPLNEMNVTARINRATTMVTNGRGRTFEVNSQAIDRIYSAAKNLVR